MTTPEESYPIAPPSESAGELRRPRFWAAVAVAIVALLGLCTVLILIAANRG